MRNVLVPITLALATLAGTTTSYAQTATQDIVISATVASYCTINNLTTAPDVNISIPVTNGIVDTTPIVSTIASVACNNAADVIATSQTGGVTPGGAPATGTTNIIDYVGEATFASATSTIDTSTTGTAAGAEAGNTATTANAATGNLVVTVTPAQPGLPLMPSNAYTDTLRVTLTAQ